MSEAYKAKLRSNSSSIKKSKLASNSLSANDVDLQAPAKVLQVPPDEKAIWTEKKRRVTRNSVVSLETIKEEE